MNITRSIAAALTVLAWGSSLNVQAQDYPSRTIRWIVPYLAGTAPDNTVRIVADAMGQILKQSVIVDNKAGAAGNLGAQLAARAPADGYMTFFLPETVAGRVALGSEVRIVLDTAPEFVIPAKVSFVASQAQFTPKTVETASERQKLMFRVRAQIDRELLLRHLDQVKTGLPGVAWLKLDSKAAWPADLALKGQP